VSVVLTAAMISHVFNDGRLALIENKESAEIVASCWLTYDGRRLYLHHLAVATDYRRRGLGRKLMRYAVEYAEHLNAQLKLEVAKSNDPAISLYRDHVFQTLDGYQLMIRRGIRRE
jgi:ribosomal protein S18 acetylase RimI-like enzyme